MKFAVPDSGVNASQALRVLKQERACVSDGHISLIRIVPVFAIHANDFIDLLLQIFAIGVDFMLSFAGSDQFLQILLHVFHRRGRGHAASGWDIGNEGPCSGVCNLDDDIVVFESLLPLEASPVNGVLITLVKEIVDTLEPGVR
jgi:hypothetical protein